MTLFADDPGSLDRLHDIATPPPVFWWPPAPAWYALGAIMVVLLVVLAWRVVAWRLRNRYRRAALAELAELEATAGEPRILAALAELVKRVALAAFPRERVASLSGVDWLVFLDASARTNAFTHGPGRILESVYECGANRADPELFAAVRHWIKYHHTDLLC
jgi:hypothetical protein